MLPVPIAFGIGPAPIDIATRLCKRFVDLEPALQNYKKVNNMLYTLAVVMLVLWVLGLVSSYTLGGFIHILLIVAIVMILVNVISGRRTS
jgi:hypothetical protein